MKLQRNRTSSIVKVSFSSFSIAFCCLQSIKSLRVSIRSQCYGENFIVEVLDKLPSRIVVCKFYG